MKTMKDETRISESEQQHENNERCEDNKQEQNKQICGGGVYCLKLEDKEHSAQFIHLKPVNFSFSHSYSRLYFSFVFIVLRNQSIIKHLR
jgi:hypothetical protein